MVATCVRVPFKRCNNQSTPACIRVACTPSRTETSGDDFAAHGATGLDSPTQSALAPNCHWGGIRSVVASIEAVGTSGYKAPGTHNCLMRTHTAHLHLLIQRVFGRCHKANIDDVFDGGKALAYLGRHVAPCQHWCQIDITCNCVPRPTRLYIVAGEHNAHTGQLWHMNNPCP
jgi:hypothetical protein